jgi:DNA-binding IclR family transcriptional regulator
VAVAVRGAARPTSAPPPPSRAVSPGIAAVLGVLEALDRRGPAGLAELATATGLPKTTLHRACTAMEERGFVERLGEGRYALAPRAVELGTRSSCSALTSAFQAEAADLRERHNETACLVVLDGADALFIAKVETTQAVRLVTRVGSRLPAFAAASGRVLLAAMAPEAVDALYAEAELVTPTGRRLDGLGELHRILGRARANGYAESVNETSLGLSCMAVPITGGGGHVLAALTLCVPAGRMDGPRRALLLADLRVAGARVSASVRAIHKPAGPA